MQALYNKGQELKLNICLIFLLKSFIQCNIPSQFDTFFNKSRTFLLVLKEQFSMSKINDIIIITNDHLICQVNLVQN